MRTSLLPLLLFAAGTMVAWMAVVAEATDSKPLLLEATIALPNVGGRIDHMAVDLARRRVWIAALGNRTVEVVDFKAGKIVHRIKGLNGPQGVAFLPEQQLIVVACGGDGTVKFFGADDFALRETIALGADADNVRIDRQSGTVVVGYGNGALALIDPRSFKKIGDITLPAHPEGFQIAAMGSRVFVNVPDRREVAVAEVSPGASVWHWKTQNLAENFPMALADGDQTVAVAFRSPARLVLFDASSGTRKAELPTCEDADDVHYDDKLRRLYVSCGEGKVDIFQIAATGLAKLATIDTASGARTSLFVPEIGRLFVAARAGWAAPASLQIYRVQP